MRTAIPFVAAVLTLVAFASPAAQPAVGALAIDQRQGDQWGWAVDYEAAAARYAALRECGAGCAVGLTFERCGAYAADQDDAATAFGGGNLTPRQTAPDGARWRSADHTTVPVAGVRVGSCNGSVVEEGLALDGAMRRQVPDGLHAEGSGSVSTEPASPVRADETCVGQPAGAACWMQVHQRPGCYVWNQRLEPGATVTWTGECAGGVARGTGTLTWTWGGIYRTDTGRVVDGRPDGHWVLRYSNQESSPHGWDVLEGPYVNGVAHGYWFLRATTSGRTSEGPLVDGQQTGHWVTRFADGNIMEGSYVDGVEHGRWIWRSADGDDVAEILYEEGEERGFGFLKLGGEGVR